LIFRPKRVKSQLELQQNQLQLTAAGASGSYLSLRVIWSFTYVFMKLLMSEKQLSFTVHDRGVQNRTNPIEKPQIEPTQTTKNRIWFGCIWIIFLLNRMVWFGLQFSFYQPNQTKPNRNIRKMLIKLISPRPILIEIQ